MACLRSDSDGSDHFCGQRFKSSHFQPERDRGAVWRIDTLGASAYVAASFGKSVLRRRSSKSGRIRRRLTVIGTPQQGQRNFGRGLTSASGLRGFTRSTICSKAIRPFLFARVRQLFLQAIDSYDYEFKNVYYSRANCCGAVGFFNFKA